MELCDALRVVPGVTAVVGGGGKTALIDRLCRELGRRGTVLRLTTTRIWPPDCPALHDPTPGELRDAFRRFPVAAAGRMTPEGKLAPPEGDLQALFAVAEYVLIEADGSRGLPLKAPGENEPVFTGLETKVIAVAGMTGLEQPIREAAHRPERYGALIGKRPEDIATPQDAASVLDSPLGQRKGVYVPFAVALNQCDTPARLALGRQVAALLRERSVLTALRADPDILEIGGNELC